MARKAATSHQGEADAGNGAHAPEGDSAHSSQGSPPNPTNPIWFELLDLVADDAKDDQVKDIIARDMADAFAGDPMSSRYTIRLLYDNESLERGHADRIYRSLQGADRQRPILLIVRSPGGSVSAAFFVAKVCRETTDQTLEVAVPREAKSAATLVCCGADKIHMGSLSELGPIDPQFGAIPALALKHSIEHLAELADKHPGAAGMLTDYLTRTLRIEALGYFERVAASAAQYAERLLRSRVAVSQPADQVEAIANHLVYAYKDHGFVIDSREATDIFGSDVVACNTAEYEFANRVYGRLDLLETILHHALGRRLSFSGDLTTGSTVPRRISSD